MDATPWKLLIVDDDEDDYILTRHMLSQSRRGKFTLEWASGYDEGLRMIQQGCYEAILMDYDLGPRNGLDLIRKSIALGIQAPIILFTGHGSYEVDLEAMHAGATLYLNKSETSAFMLERSIRYAIERKQIEASLLQRTKELEDARAEAENEKRRLEAVMNALPVGVAITDIQGGNVLSNKMFDQVWGGPRPDTHSVKDYASYHAWWAETGKPVQPEEWASAQVIEQGQAVIGQILKIQRFDGSFAYVQNSAAPVRDHTGKIAGSAVALEDITSLLNIKRALQKSEELYRDIIKTAPAAIYEVDFRARRFTSVNDAMCELSGYSRDELLNMSPFDILDEEGKILFRERINRWLAGEEPGKNVEYKVKAKDGHTIDALLNISFTIDEEGQPLGATVIGFDVTDRKRMEEELHQNQKFLRRLVETSFEGIWSVDQSGKTTFVNQRAAEILGYTVDEIQGQNAFQFLMSEDIEAGQQTLEQIARGESGRVEAHARHRNGSELWLLTSYSPIINEQGEFEGALAMFSDITERKRADGILKESEERFRAMADSSPLMIWLTNADMGTEFVNQAYTDFFGVTLEQIRSEGWQSLVHPDDAVDTVETYLVCHQQRKPYHAEVRVKRKDDQWRWMESFGQPRFSPTGEYLGLIGIGLDISDRKQMEQALQEYTARLRSSNQELENFAFTASHDLQEPLRKIEIFGDLLRQEAGSKLNETQGDYLERMQNSAARMSKMIDDLLTLSRVTTQGQPFVEVDLNQVVQLVIEDLEVRIRQTGGCVELEELPVIQADPLQMHQLFQNLIGNALKFHKEGIPPNVKVRSQRVLDDQVEICVEDNGIGFDMTKASRLFQPFQRLQSRQEYEGTGIGLSICKKIVERHQGSISARGRIGEGAEFIVKIPIQQFVNTPSTG